MASPPVTPIPVRASQQNKRAAGEIGSRAALDFPLPRRETERCSHSPSRRLLLAYLLLSVEEGANMSSLLTAPEVLNREFLEIRSKILELAAALDRIARADGS